MTPNQEPVVLELAPLLREQAGPFLLLGLDKDASPEEIEANWAQRVIWARKKHIRTPLGDVNWAREVMTDLERRIRADATSLNVDTASGTLRRLADAFNVSAAGSPAWKPIDVEKLLDDYVPPAQVPDIPDVRAAIVLPEWADEFPAVRTLLEDFARQPLDPWSLDFTPAC
jgi:hypothetical protein